MFLTKQQLVMARRLGVAILVAGSLASCATYKEEFAGINLMRRCRALRRVPNRPISPRSRQTSGWIKSKAASSSSKGPRAVRRGADPLFRTRFMTNI